jgi:hypothetical protein
MRGMTSCDRCGLRLIGVPVDLQKNTACRPDAWPLKETTGNGIIIIPAVPEAAVLVFGSHGARLLPRIAPFMFELHAPRGFGRRPFV